MIEVVVISAITVCVYFTLAFRIHKMAPKIIAGHSFWVDLLFTAVIAAFAGLTGSLTAMMISSVTGLFISLTLFGMNWYYGSARLVRKVNAKTGKKSWKLGVQEFPPTKKLPNWMTSIISKFKSQSNLIAA